MQKMMMATAAAAGAAGLAWLTSRLVGSTVGQAIMGSTQGGGVNHWLTVTVNCPPERLAADGGQLPEPITRLAGRTEVSVRPAPGDRGSELGLRLISPPPEGLAVVAARLRGGDPRQELRRALRDAKSLIETGEVIRPDEPPTTHPTVTGKLLDLAIARSGGEGRL